MAIDNFMISQLPQASPLVGTDQVVLERDGVSNLRASIDQIVGFVSPGSGTQDVLTRWIDTLGNLGDSALSQSGSDVTAAGDLSVTRDAAGADVRVLIENTSDDPGSSATLEIKNGASNADGPVLLFDYAALNWGFAIDATVDGGAESAFMLFTGLNPYDDASQIMTVSEANIGIGDISSTLTELPIARLHIAQLGLQAQIAMERVDSSVASDTIISEIETIGGETLSLNEVFRMVVESDAAWAPGDSPTRVSFWTTPIGSIAAVEGWRLNNAGNFSVLGNIVSTGEAMGVTNNFIGGAVQLLVANTDATDSGSDAQFLIQAEDTGGCPYLQWKSGSQSYVMGIDNLDSESLVGSVGSVLGTANWIEVLTTGDVEFLQDVIVIGDLMVGRDEVPRAALETFGDVYVGGTDSTVEGGDIVSTLAFLSFDSSGSPPTNDVVAAISAVAQFNHISGSFRTGLAFFTMDGITLSEQMRIDRFGNVGIGTTDPTIMLDVNERAGQTSIGGWVVKMINETGSNTVAGQLVVADTVVPSAFVTAGTSSSTVVGIVYNGGVADGEEAWVVVGGYADVFMDSGGAAAGDRLVSSTITVGRAEVNNGPSNTVHFTEIGHSVGAIGGAGLVRALIHLL